MRLRQTGAFLLGLIAGTAAATSLSPVEVGGISYFSEYYLSGERREYYRTDVGRTGISLGTEIHTDKQTGYLRLRRAGYAAFQIPVIEAAPGFVGRVTLDATLGWSRSAIDVWDLVGHPAPSQSFYLDATGGRSYGSLSKNSYGPSPVSSPLDPRVFSDLLARSGSVLYMGFSSEDPTSITGISLTFTPAVFATPLPAGFLLLGSGLVGLIGFGKLRKKTP